MIQIIPIKGIPVVQTEQELWKSFETRLEGIVQDGDILVMAHTPFSRVRGPIFKLDEIEPSERAVNIGKKIDKDPRKVEVILQCSDEIIKIGNRVIITKNKAGIICANGGVDESNAGIGYVIGIPENPDGLAEEIVQWVQEKFEKRVAVIISDTVGRALRMGAVNIAIGVAGLNPLISRAGEKDLFGYTMRVTSIAVADEIASAAELVQGQTDEAVPLVIVRGYSYEPCSNCSSHSLNRPDENRLFR